MCTADLTRAEDAEPRSPLVDLAINKQSTIGSSGSFDQPTVVLDVPADQPHVLVEVAGCDSLTMTVILLGMISGSIKSTLVAVKIS